MSYSDKKKRMFVYFYLRRLRQKQVKESLSLSVCPSQQGSTYLSVICSSNSFQSILFKLCIVFIYILKMCTSYYGLSDVKLFFFNFQYVGLKSFFITIWQSSFKHQSWGCEKSGEGNEHSYISMRSL
jgi:hypothetical protein